MTTSNSAAPRTFGPGIVFAALFALVQRIPANLLRWIVVLGRAPRARPPRWPAGVWLAYRAHHRGDPCLDVLRRHGGERLGAAFAALVDGRRRPNHQFRPVRLFLYPLGFVLLCLAAVMAPSLPRMTQGMLAALAARFGFLFVAIGLPSLFATIVKRLIGRARPYVGGHDDPFAYMPFVWKPEYASMPSGHATTAAAAAIAIGAIWPRFAPRDVALRR